MPLHACVFTERRFDATLDKYRLLFVASTASSGVMMPLNHGTHVLAQLTVPYSFAIENESAVWSEITHHDWGCTSCVVSFNICSS